MVIKAFHNFASVRAKVTRIKTSADFSQVVLEGMNAIQTAQRRAAPLGNTGRVRRSIRPARITRTQNGVRGISRTTYGPAIFTNEGTGTFATPQIIKSGAPKGTAYFTPFAGGFWHPGIRGSGWYAKGFNVGKKIALESFRRKVETMLDARG